MFAPFNVVELGLVAAESMLLVLGDVGHAQALHVHSLCLQALLLLELALAPT
jgi:hypothetical protein